MTGPAGTSVRCGAGPRSFGMVLQSRLLLSLTHSQGLPKMPLRARPCTRRAFAAETSTIQRLRPGPTEASLTLTKEMLRASGDQATKRIFAPAGNPETG